MQRIEEELYFDDGTRAVSFHPAVPSGLVIERGRRYSFELYRKQTHFGDVPVDQFWMNLCGLYGDRKKSGRNHGVIVEYYWAQCTKALTIFEDAVVDSYILANLLPYVRRYGSRHVFADAIPAAPQRFEVKKAEWSAQLDAQLAASRHEALDMQAFHSRTAELLGPPTLTPAQEAAYRTLADELLGEGRAALGRWGKPGLQVPILKFQNWMQTFARRSGNEDKKFALDMLSYECRAALQRCYSAVWYELIRQLERKYGLDAASVQFHRLMHVDVQFPSQLPNADFHLFHGHVFALHPGLGPFLQTPTGGALVGDYLQADGDDLPFRRLLHGIWVGLIDYDLRRREYAENRKACNRSLKVYDFEELASAQTGGKGRRRLYGPQHGRHDHDAN